jgi:hypothetical protein
LASRESFTACLRHIMRFPSCRPRRRHPGGAS